MRAAWLTLGLVLLVAGSAVAFQQAFFPAQDAGDAGADVATIQHLLRERGYGLPQQSSGLLGFLSDLLFGADQGLRTDGAWDAATDQHVRNFQRDHNLSVDGIVGSQTWSALVVTIRQGSSGEAVQALQTELNAKRGAGLPVSGSFDGATDAAVRAFQTHAGIGVDGIVGPVTWKNLVWHYQQPATTASSPVCAYGAADARWGSAATIAHLQLAAAAFNASRGGKLSVGDVSLEHGGDIAGHASHEVGLDFDTRPVRLDGDQCHQGCTWQQGCYDRAGTRALIQAVRDAAPGHVVHVWFNDPQLVSEGLAEPLDGHDNHFHTRYCEAVHPDSRYVC